MSDPVVEFPHETLAPAEYAPRFFTRDGRPATEADAAQAFEDRGVAWTVIRAKDGSRALVSTVFLALDHGIDGSTAAPILFETAVFDGSGLVFRARSRTESDARAAHASAVIDLVAAIETHTPTDPFPTSPVETSPTAYLAAVPLTSEGTHDDEHPDGDG